MKPSNLFTIARLQWLMTWRNPEQLLPILLVPLSTFVAASIFVEGGRTDLLPRVFVAFSLMCVAQTALFTASEILVGDRSNGQLETMLVTTASYPVTLGVRVLVVSSAGLVGGLLSYLILFLCYDARPLIRHPLEALGAVVGATYGSGGMALLLAALICRTKSVRAVQNSLSGPLFLLSGVLVPVGLLSPWLEKLSGALYLSWAAHLMRDSLDISPPPDTPFRLFMLVLTGTVLGLGGALLLTAMLKRMRREGAL